MNNTDFNMRCKRCGRVLKNKKSIELGYGYICHKKYLENMLNQNTILQYLEKE